jgi:hypothetical protein
MKVLSKSILICISFHNVQASERIINPALKYFQAIEGPYQEPKSQHSLFLGASASASCESREPISEQGKLSNYRPFDISPEKSSDISPENSFMGKDVRKASFTLEEQASVQILGKQVSQLTRKERSSVVKELALTLETDKTDEVAMNFSPEQRRKAAKTGWSCCCSSNAKSIIQTALDILSDGPIESKKEREARERQERIALLLEKSLIEAMTSLKLKKK